MRNTTIALVLTLSASTVFASTHEQVLAQVDALVAADTYEKAFNCNQNSMTEDKACWGGECSQYMIASHISSCGSMTTISTTDGEESGEQQINKVLYNQLKGNPLRFFNDSNKYKDSSLEWTSAQAMKIDYMGAKRNALKVTGTIELCYDESEEEIPGEEYPLRGQNCSRGPVQVMIIQGVPFLARVPSMNFDVDGFTVTQSLIDFSGKQ